MGKNHLSICLFAIHISIINTFSFNLYTYNYIPRFHMGYFRVFINWAYLLPITIKTLKFSPITYDFALQFRRRPSWDKKKILPTVNINSLTVENKSRKLFPTQITYKSYKECKSRMLSILCNKFLLMHPINSVVVTSFKSYWTDYKRKSSYF